MELEVAQIACNLDGFLVLTEDGDYVSVKMTDDGLTLTPLPAMELS